MQEHMLSNCLQHHLKKLKLHRKQKWYGSFLIHHVLAACLLPYKIAGEKNHRRGNAEPPSAHYNNKKPRRCYPKSTWWTLISSAAEAGGWKASLVTQSSDGSSKNMPTCTDVQKPLGLKSLAWCDWLRTVLPKKICDLWRKSTRRTGWLWKIVMPSSRYVATMPGRANLLRTINSAHTSMCLVSG